jgi:hypothetical protein
MAALRVAFVAIVFAAIAAFARASDDTVVKFFDVFSPDSQYRLVGGLCPETRDAVAWVPVSSTSPDTAGQWRRQVGLLPDGKRYSRLCWQALPITSTTVGKRSCVALSATNQLVLMSPKLSTPFLSASVFYHNTIVLSNGLANNMATFLPTVLEEAFVCPSSPAGAQDARSVGVQRGVLTYSTSELPNTDGVALTTSLDSSQTPSQRTSRRARIQ